MLTINEYKQSAEYIKSKIGDFTPDVIMVLGSGLGFMGGMVENPIHIPYSEIPHFKASTAPGHEGRFVIGTLSGKNVMVMQGRLHLYEGYEAEEAAYPIRVAKLLGAKTMVVTNACGGVNTSYKVGELIVLKDYIMFSGKNPLIGKNLPDFGPRFCDMSHTFDTDYIELAKKVGEEQGLKLKEGVYFYMTGPQYETPAEIRAIRTMGGDVVGMSTVPECIVANHAGMKILGVSLVTNMAAGVLDKALSEEEVLEEAAKARDYFSNLLMGFLGRI